MSDRELAGGCIDRGRLTVESDREQPSSVKQISINAAENFIVLS
jgi:hypothetical protein